MDTSHFQDHEQKESEIFDLHKESTEKKYHNIVKYKSAGVLEHEKTILDEIISYKKTNNFQYDFFETKKTL